MDSALGLIGLVLYLVAVLALSAGVTFVVVKLTPDRAKKKAAEATEAKS
jgi:hypothetical protein